MYPQHNVALETPLPLVVLVVGTVTVNSLLSTLPAKLGFPMRGPVRVVTLPSTAATTWVWALVLMSCTFPSLSAILAA